MGCDQAQGQAVVPQEISTHSRMAVQINVGLRRFGQFRFDILRCGLCLADVFARQLPFEHGDLTIVAHLNIDLATDFQRGADIIPRGKARTDLQQDNIRPPLLLQIRRLRYQEQFTPHILRLKRLAN